MSPPNSQEFEKYIQTVFPEFPSHLRGLDGVGNISVLRGDPGAGKTLLSFIFAQRLINLGFNVLYIPIEQPLDSVRKVLVSFGDAFSSLCGRTCRLDKLTADCASKEISKLQDEPSPKSSDSKPPRKRGFLFTHKHNLSYNSGSNLKTYLRDTLNPQIKAVESALDNGKIDLVIVDNMNVISDWNGDAPTSKKSSAVPFNQPDLMGLCSTFRDAKTNLLMILEGCAGQEGPSFVDYSADTLIDLKREQESSIINVAKSRHTPPSSGDHSIRFASNRIWIWPSPEAMTRETLKDYIPDDKSPPKWTWSESADVKNSPISGWKEHFGFVPSSGDLICITGPVNSGKSVLAQALVQAGNIQAIRTIGTSAVYTDGPLVYRDKIPVRNWLFQVICVDIVKAFEKYGACGINLARLEALYPSIGTSEDFVSYMLGLIRRLKLACVIEVASESRLLNQVAQSADCSITLSEAGQAEQGLRILNLATTNPEYEEVQKNVVAGFRPAPIEGKAKIAIDPQLLLPWRIGSNGSASRVKVHLLLPFGSPGEDEYAHALGLHAGLVVGDQSQINLTKILTKVQYRAEIEKSARDAQSSEDSDSPHASFALTGYLDKLSIPRLLDSLSDQIRDDLSILVCDDHVLGVTNPNGNIPNNSDVLGNLSPLGSLDSWKGMIFGNDGDGEEDKWLVDPLVNSEGEVVAIPYMMDAGFLVHRKDFSTRLSKVNTSTEITEWADLLKGIKAVRKKNWVQKALEFFGHTDGLWNLYQFLWRRHDQSHAFSFGFENQETRVFFLLEALMAQGEDPNKLGNSNVKFCMEIRELLGIPNEGGGYREDLLLNPTDRAPVSDPGFDGSLMRREWFSKLSRVGLRDILDISALGLSINPLPQRLAKRLMKIRYFVIPKGSSNIDLGIKLIEAFASKDQALERTHHFVGLSPYASHYPESVKGFKWLTDTLPFGSDNPNSERSNKEKKKDFREFCLLRSRVFEDYLKNSRDISDRAREVLLIDNENRIGSTWGEIQKQQTASADGADQ